MLQYDGPGQGLQVTVHSFMVSIVSYASSKNCFFFFLYQLFLQGLDPVLVHSPLIGELLLGHFLRHLDSLHHLLHCLQMGLFNFCLQSEMQRKGFRGILTLIISLHEYTLPFRSNVFC